MPEVGALPLAAVAVPAGPRSAATRRRAGIAAGRDWAARPHGRAAPSDGAAPCERAAPVRWLLPVILGGAAIWAWVILRLI